MKSNKMAKKVAASVLTGSMVFSMGGMTAFAATLEPVETKIGITKKLSTDPDNKTYAPHVGFTFNVKTGPAEDSLSYEANGETKTTNVRAGLAGGLTIEDEEDEATFNPDMTPENGVYTVRDQVKLTVHEDVFTQAGVYHYEVKEESTVYEGITCDTNYYDVYVFVEFNGGKKTCTYIAYQSNASGDQISDGKVGELVFDNDYGAKAELDSTHDVTITKKTAGNQARDDDPFKINVSIDSAGDGEKFDIVAQIGETTQNETITDGGNVEFTIYADDTITIYGLTEGDTITVEETDSGSGYVESYSITNGATDVTPEEEKGNKIVFNVKEDSADVIVTNTKDVSAPTGIAMTFAPYALMVAAAGGFGALFLRGKKREDF